MNKDYQICVLGGGSFGTVLANLAASKGHDVSLWVKDSDKALSCLLYTSDAADE